MSDFFPQEVILQILHKLPIKSLVRCLCVCKTWDSLIRSPFFISTHLTLTISSNTTTNAHLLLFRLCSEESEHYSLRLDNQQLAPYMPLGFPFKSCSSYFRIICSLNGIIFLVDDLFYLYNYTYILWNPLIKKSLTLPNPSVTYSSHGSFVSFIGFGLDSKANDYKVLRILHLHEQKEEGEEATIEAELYSLNTNSWKSITSYAPKYQCNERDKQAFVNGVVHWIAFKEIRNEEFRNVVLGFHMGDEAFCEIKLPQSLACVNPIELSVRKYGDSSIAVIKEDLRKCHIWIMKEYGIVGSWTKIASVGILDGGLPKVLGFRKNGEVLLQTYCDMMFFCGRMYSPERIVSYDPQSEGVKDLGITDQAGRCFIDGYVESLVLLDNANAVSDANAANNQNNVWNHFDYGQ